MHNAPTDSKQQAINGVKDSLPGYRIQPIFFNGNCVGYKWEKVGALEERTSKFRIFGEDLKRRLKWNW